MAIPSSLRARRSANRPVELTQQTIAFCLRNHWFALPMEVVKRVGSLDPATGSVSGATADSTIDMVRDLPLVNATQRIFPDTRETLDPQTNRADDLFLIVFETSSGTYGLTVSSTPKLLRISQGNVAPFRSETLGLDPVRCISGVATQPDEPQALYLLDPAQLCQDA
jgi:chemotaxis signal transduction protein